MFTKILYINLDRRKDRNIHINKELKKLNWNGPIERISAIDGSTLNLDSLNMYFDNNSINQAKNTKKINFRPGSYMTKGALGCALSHRKAWLNIYNGKDNKVLILEDDIHIDNKFNDKLQKYLKYIPDYDLLYLGFHDSLNNIVINDYISKPKNNVFGLYGYIVDKRIAKKLIDMFPIKFQIDSYIKLMYPNIKVYHLNKNYTIINSEHSLDSNFGTDIQVIENFDSKLSNMNIIFIILILIIFYQFI
jgi:hypothetical protein